MNTRIRRKTIAEADSLRAVRDVLHATGGAAKVEELYRLLTAEEAAEFLGLALQTVRNMTARHELPVIRTGKRGVGYRLADLIAWQDSRREAMAR